MSIIVAVGAVATVNAGSTVFIGMATAAAATLGLKAIQETETAIEQNRRAAMKQAEVSRLKNQSQQVQISSATEAAVAEVVSERQELHFASDNMELTVKRDIRGKVTVTAHGHGMSRTEVEDFAHRYLGLLRQQVAYRQAVTALKRHGFRVANESRSEDGTVQVRINRRRN